MQGWWRQRRRRRPCSTVGGIWRRRMGCFWTLSNEVGVWRKNRRQRKSQQWWQLLCRFLRSLVKGNMITLGNEFYDLNDWLAILKASMIFLGIPAMH